MLPTRLSLIGLRLMSFMEYSDIVEMNPFTSTDVDRHAIWEILVRGDFEAFVAGKWSMIASDFWEEGFCGIDAGKEYDPSQWRLTFPDLESYRIEWLRQISQFASVRLIGTDIRKFLYESCRLTEIDIKGDRAIARKAFDGMARTLDGNEIVLSFQSVYQMVRRNERWLIAGFVGYLPNSTPHNPSAHIAQVPW